MDLKIQTTSLSVLFFCASLSPFHCLADEKPTYYQDCSVISFDEIDESTMTEAEKILALDAALFGALDESERCMNAAAQTGAQGMAGAAGGGAGSASSAAGAAGSGNAAAQTPPSPQENQQSTNDPSDPAGNSKQSSGGPANSGSSAVCDAVEAGMKGATTDAEKQHFQNLKAQYGC